MAISVADNFSYKGSKPLDARFQFSSVANMKAEPVANLYDGCLAYVTATKKYYTFDSSNTSTEETGKWAELQTGGGGGGSYTAGDGIVIDNDEISVDEMESADMPEILTPLPSVMSRRFKYSTEEQIVGEWIDGKPLYQKTVPITTASSTGTYSRVEIGATVDYVQMLCGVMSSGTGNYYPLSTCNNTFNAGLNVILLNNQHSQHANKVTIYHTENTYSSKQCYITIQYTKATD